MDNQHIANLAKFYKTSISSRYQSIAPDEICERISKVDEYFVSTKLDGHFYLLAFDHDEILLINHKGKTVTDLDLLAKIKEFFQKNGVKKIVVAGELYLDSETRSRSFNLTKALSEQDPNIKYAVFDIVELNDEIHYTKDNQERIKTIEDIFPKNGYIHHVNNSILDSRASIENLFNQRVINDGFEGLVVRSTHAIYKLKPKYTFDATIIGFAEGDGDRKGMIRDLLLAFMHQDGSLQVIGHLHHGLNDKALTDLLVELNPKIVASEYIEVATNKVAFKFIKPELVVEFSALDVIVEDSSSSISKMCLNYTVDNGYKVIGKRNSASFTSACFVRFRNDKTVSIDDIRFDQIKEVVSFEGVETVNEQDFAKSTIIRREVYTKVVKETTAVRKFVLLKTNKEDTNKYPAYVVQYTDYSADRKDPLARDLKLSNSFEQIQTIFDDLIAQNIKKGWNLV